MAKQKNEKTSQQNEFKKKNVNKSKSNKPNRNKKSIFNKKQSKNNAPKPKKENRPQKNKTPKKPDVNVRIAFLGGLNEVGKNMTLYECENDMILDRV
jgi:ribonuclease J